MICRECCNQRHEKCVYPANCPCQHRDNAVYINPATGKALLDEDKRAPEPVESKPVDFATFFASVQPIIRLNG